MQRHFNLNAGTFDSRPQLSRTTRELSTVCLSAITQLQFTLITAASQAYFCNISSQLQTTSVVYPELQFQQGGNEWKTLTFTNQSSQVIPNACKNSILPKVNRQKCKLLFNFLICRQRIWIHVYCNKSFS